MIHVYFGSDSGLNLYRAKEDLKRSYKGEAYQSIIKYDGYKDLVSSILYDCQSSSLFGDEKVILVQNAYFLTKQKAKGVIKESDQDYDSLITYIKNPDENVDLYLVANDTLDPTSKVVKALKELPASFEDCQKLSLDDYMMLAFKRSKEEGKEIDRDAIQELYNRTQDDFLLFNNELDKVFLCGSKVTVDVVKKLVYKPLNDKVYQITSNLISGNTKEAIAVYEDIRKAGTLPLVVLSALATLFKNTYLIKVLIERGMNNDEISKELTDKSSKVSTGKVYYTRRDTKYMTSSTFIDILSELASIEFDVKLNADDADVRLFVFMSMFRNKYLSRKY